MRRPTGASGWLAALLDLDGTLVDTEPGVRAAIRAAFADVPGTVLADDRLDLSLPLDAMLRRADPTASASRLRSLSEGFRRHYDGTYWADAQLYPGAGDFVRALRAGGLRMCVVTNKRTTAAERLLTHFRLAGRLDAIVGQPDTGQAIPKHELIGGFLARQGLDPATTVVVGDSDQDAAAATSWGMLFVAVTSGAGPLGHAAPGERRIEVSSLVDAAMFLVGRPRRDSREP